MATSEAPSRRELWSWALYDFANSPFSTTVTTVIFNVYFASVVAAAGVTVGGYSIPGPSLWAYLVAASSLTMGLLSPFLGAVADCSGAKKRFLFAFTALGALATALLYFARPGTAASASAAFFAANLAFAGAFSFYSAFLPELADKDHMGRVSGFGWALGYIGGGACLALNLLMLQKPALFGIPAEDHLPIRLGFLVVGAWWLVFSLPLFLWLKERARPTGEAGWGLLRHATERTFKTLREVRRYPELAKFLIAYLLYNDGIETVIVMASIFAAEEIGMGQGEIIQCFLVLQGVAFLGSLLFGRLADAVGNRKAVFLTLLLWGGVLAWALGMRTATEFWWAGVLIGLILGGSQSASRSLFAVMTPKENAAEFFGFFSLSGKMVATLGPLSFGLMRQWLGSVRYAVVSLVLFFAAGAAILAWVDEKKGEAEAERPVDAA